MDFEAIVGKEIWSHHQQNVEQVQSLMRESQEMAAKIDSRVAHAYESLERTRTAAGKI